MGDIWKQFTKSVSPQWLLFSFMPAFTFWFLAIGGLAVHEKKLRELIQNPGVFESVIFLVVVVVSAWILSMITKSTVMLFEGYFLPSKMKQKLLRMQIKKWKKLREKWQNLIKELKSKKQKDPEYINILNQFRMVDTLLVYNFPLKKENIMPTNIGNILKASEEYPRLRYGIDPIVLWEHLYMQLPDELKSALDTSFNEMFLMLTSSVLSFVLGIEWAALSFMKAFSTGSAFKVALALFFFLVFTLFAINFYKVSIVAALKFSRLIRTSFDLYRGKLA